jgi:DNA modification methylase
VLDQVVTDGFAMYNGDSAEVLAGLPDASVGLAIFSPPFQSLYTYSPSDRDLGNSRDAGQFWDHFAYISRELSRVMMPGRNVCIHVAQIGTTKVTHGVTGLVDFRGDTIRHFVEAGFTYHGEVCIDKDPQAQAIRTKSKALLFVQMDRDAAWLRPALADYIVVMRAPGDNRVPVKPELDREEWIEWARPIWYGIRESDTLNVALARTADDEKHIAPLQLGTIERCIRLWSNRGDVVLSPFAGIGSEGYVALQHGRRFVGVELKPAYWRVAVEHLRQAEGLLSLGLVG